MADYTAAGPLQEPIIPETETPPKRTRGRPRKDGTPTGSPRETPPRIARANLQPQIAGLLTMINLGATMFVPKDALDDIEILALSQSLAEEAKRNPRFAKMIESALAVGGGAGLFGLIGFIAARRLARHGYLPQEADAQFGLIIAMQAGIKPGAMPFTPPADTQPTSFTGEQAA